MKLFLLFAIVFSNVSLNQDSKQLKNNIIKSFKDSSKSYSFDCFWLICNNDSSYYLSDTIKLYNHENYYYDPSYCCEFVKWEFEGSSKFRLSETMICKEPPTSKSYANNLYKIKWDSDRTDLYLTIVNTKKKNVVKFLVLDLYEEKLWNDIHLCKVLKLKRI